VSWSSVLRERWAERLTARPPQVALAGLAAGLAFAGAGTAALPVALGALAAGGILRVPRLGLLAACAVATGAFVGAARLEAIDAAGERLRDGQHVSGRAHLLGPPRPGAFGISAEVEMVSGPSTGARLLARLPREWRVPRRLRVGAELSLSGSFGLVQPDPEAEFDHAAHLRRQGVAGELAVARVRLTGRARGGLAGAVDAIRVRADAALVAGLDPSTAALARGMVLGADEEVDPAVREDFRDSGLAHVLAVSGQNVMLLVALAVPLLTLAGLSHTARIPALMGLIALYVPLTGAGPSIQRAGIMGAASLAAVALSRPPSRWYVLGLAACATLALNPRAFGDPGWQLSFAAVVGILLLAGGLRRRLGGLPHAAAEGIAITVAATVATAPLLAHHFGSVSLAALPANVVALPLVAPIMWLGMLRAGLGQAISPEAAPGAAISLACELPGRLLARLIGALRDVAGTFADMPGGQLSLPLESASAVLAAYAAIAAVVVAATRVAARYDTRMSTAAAYLRRLPRSRQAALACSVGALAALVFARGLSPQGPPGELTVTFLDVGQGDATLIQHPDGSAVLFDGGPPEGGVARLLRRAGVRHLSALVMTHASRDHHGGLSEVVQRFPVELLLDGGDGTRDRAFRATVAEAVRRGARRVRVQAPLGVRAGEIGIEVLSPPPRPPGPPPEDPNPRAVVAVVSSGGFDLLLSGDAESPSLEPLAIPDVDAMKLPHHGSADEGLPALLTRLRPEAAAIPVGANTYGHPAPSTLAALRRAGVPTWRTDLNGSVRLLVGGGRLRVEPERGDVASTP
jgi:competence protein ComEC